MSGRPQEAQGVRDVILRMRAVGEYFMLLGAGCNRTVGRQHGAGLVVPPRTGPPPRVAVRLGRVHNILFSSFSSHCTAYTPGVPTGSLQSLNAVYGLLACMLARY